MNGSRKKKRSEKLLNAFGKTKDDSFHFEQIESYFKKKDHSGISQVLNKKTCNDFCFSYMPLEDIFE